MLHYFLFPLKSQLILFNLLKYITFRSLAAFITAFIIGVLIAPYFIKKFKTIGLKQAIRTDGPETHHVKSGTPTMGGIIIIAAALASIFLWTIFNYYVFVVSLSILLFAAIGFIDDYLKIKYKNSKGIKGMLKLILQTVFSALIITLLYLNPARPDIFWAFYIPFFSQPVWIWTPLPAYLFYIFTMVSFSNATNLSDGLDGLASGMGILLYLPFGIIAYVIGNAIAAQYLKFPFFIGAGELAVIISSMIGGFTAFLWYNTHPAEVFMGDTGSLAMGGAIATIAIVLKQELLLVVAGGMFVLETLSVVIQTSYFKYTRKKFGEGKRFFLMAPLHHHFEKKGWKETQVVMRFWILAALCALIAISALKVR
jgi:phospho-N-acetylmuramoyl-pentapeptide-transferase